jgi:hypothetical protein
VAVRSSWVEIPLPRGWLHSVKSGVLHVVSLARFAMIHTRGWAAAPASTEGIVDPFKSRRAQCRDASDCRAGLRRGQLRGARNSQLAPLALPQFSWGQWLRPVNSEVVTAQGIPGFDPDAAAIDPGRVMVTRLRSLATTRVDFVFETTLAGRTFAPWIGELPCLGDAFSWVLLWLPSVEAAIGRRSRNICRLTGTPGTARRWMDLDSPRGVDLLRLPRVVNSTPGGSLGQDRRRVRTPQGESL